VVLNKSWESVIVAGMSEQENFRVEPYWLDERDWLCLIEFLPDDDEEQRAYGAEAIGYYFGYAQLTDTRMLALLGDPVGKAYELLFSFSSPENKTLFLELIQSNELTETEPELLIAPTVDEIRDAQPIGLVLPKDVNEYATLLAASLMTGTDSEILN